MRPSAVPTPQPALIDALATCPTDDPIFALDAEAKARARAGESIVNATLGSLMEDDGRLAVLPTVYEAYARIDRSVASSYAPLAGPEAFRRAVIEDVFGQGELASWTDAVATAGGTGAIHCALSAFLEADQALLTTDYYWGPYQVLAAHTGRRVATFPMFAADGGFHLAAFESALERLAKEQGRLLVLLNFPCHNPTGYTLSRAEWEGIAARLRAMGERVPTALLVDLAYARYAPGGSASWQECLRPAAETCTLLVAWSASKTYAQYGARVGALLATTPDADQRRAIRGALTYVCRGTWSNCNHLGLLAVTELLRDPDLRARADADRRRMTELLAERVSTFRREAARNGLSIPRYEGGFFVLVFTPDAKVTAEVARERGVYVVPVKGAVRVAICSTPKQDIPRLAEALAAGVARARPAG